MRDKRPVDELSIEELERILALRKREARRENLRKYERRRVKVGSGVAEETPPPVYEPQFVDDDGEDAPMDAPPPPSLPVRRPKPNVPEAYYRGTPQFEDEIEGGRESQANTPGPKGQPSTGWKVWWNRALTVVEVGAVVGLLALVIGLLGSFQSINQRSAQMQAEFEATSRAAMVPPTATPVINIAAVVLPSGHKVDSAGQNAEFNLEEVPAQYRAQYVAYLADVPVARPTPSAEGPVRVQIPRIGVDSVVVAGDDWEALKLGVGHHIGSVNPGQAGNMVLSGHNDVYGEIFRHLDRLQPGDQIIVNTRTKTYTYVVQPHDERGRIQGYRVVQPTDTWVLGARGDLQQLTLISCYPYRVSNKRIVVFATLQS